MIVRGWASAWLGCGQAHSSHECKVVQSPGAAAGMQPKATEEDLCHVRALRPLVREVEIGCKKLIT